MKSILNTIIGFEWIQNVAIKNAARYASVAILALAAKSAPVLGVLNAFGLTGDDLTNGFIAVGLAILGAVRGWAKPKVTPPSV